MLGYLGPATSRPAPADDDRAGDPVGRSGVERQYESQLRGRRGTAVELTDHGGRFLGPNARQEPRSGRDLVLTLDPKLQAAAEQLLADALERRANWPGRDEPAGGAIAVMDLRDGGLLAAASAPGFDPNLFPAGDTAARQALLHATDSPLFDRVVQMALPPGSVFKTLTAIALLESATVDPQEPFTCQGYLHDPRSHAMRDLYPPRHRPRPVTLADALAQSCNVYFFHHAGAWAPRRWAIGRRGWASAGPTGVDLPGEAAGVVPTPRSIRRLEGHGWRTADTQMMAVGQGSLTATPLQVLRLMAAVATGRLLTPHVAD